MRDTEKKKAESVEKVRALWRELQPTLERLYGRWLDEREYEDIKDYARPLTPKVETAGGIVLGMTKRPFGIKVKIAGCACHFTITARQHKATWVHDT